MHPQPSKPLTLLQSINLQLREHQYEKALKQHQQSSHREPCQQEKKAKQTLIQVDDEYENNEQQTEEEVVGRWSNYRVPAKMEERMSLSCKSKRNSTGAVPAYRYLEYQDRGYLPTLCRSQKTIPKLKVILNQLQCPLNIQSDRKSTSKSIKAPACSSAKMRNHIGMQALVISNKQEIKSNSIKSQRKSTISHSDPHNHNIQNRRPPSGASSRFKATIPASSAYQKIKRGGNTGNNFNDCQLIYEKEILSQLLKGNTVKTANGSNNGTLGQMLNFFTKNGNETKKKVSIKMGLDKLLS